ncbi:hypothetical protein GCM10010869_24770 [Mesorhizobium tianshanense]|nr:hypothetical protein GCM10010869_24770 [Mesorhizobium tianshanense]
MDWLSPDPELAADGSFRDPIDISMVDQSDSKTISDKAQQGARTDVMFDDRGELHAASNSIGEQKWFAPADEQRLLIQLRPLDHRTS